MDSCDKFIPKCKPCTKKCQWWVDKDVIRSVRLKWRAWIRFRKNKCDEIGIIILKLPAHFHDVTDDISRSMKLNFVVKLQESSTKYKSQLGMIKITIRVKPSKIRA